MDNFAPIVTKEIIRPSVPWTTGDIIEAITGRNVLQRDLKINKSKMNLLDQYKLEKKRVKSFIDNGVKKNIIKEFQDTKNDIAATLKSVRRIISFGRNNSEQTGISNSLEDKAKEFNEFLAYVGKKNILKNTSRS